MRKKVCFLFLLAFVLCAQISPALACIGSYNLGPGKTLELLKEAVFVGKVRIKETGIESDHDAILEIVQPYKGFRFKSQVYIKGFVYSGYCKGPAPPDHTVYEEVILKKDNHYILVDGVLDYTIPEWAILRQTAEKSPKLTEMQNACRTSGGEWVNHHDGRFYLSDCHYLTADDGKACKDSIECEGFCIADSEKNGECSRWKNLHEARHGLLQNGYPSEPYYGVLSK